jgi:hypothetical protein
MSRYIILVLPVQFGKALPSEMADRLLNCPHEG